MQYGNLQKRGLVVGKKEGSEKDKEGGGEKRRKEGMKEG